MILRYSCSTLFPYTTLFRSLFNSSCGINCVSTSSCDNTKPSHSLSIFTVRLNSSFKCFSIIRSEEHTSELQSRGHLVCRLLLEKKKENPRHFIIIFYSDLAD